MLPFPNIDLVGSTREGTKLARAAVAFPSALTGVASRIQVGARGQPLLSPKADALRNLAGEASGRASALVYLHRRHFLFV